MAYNTDQDWTDEAEAEEAAVRRARSGGNASSLGVPIVTAVLGLLVGALGSSLWWHWASSTRLAAQPATTSAASPKAPVPKEALSAPAPVIVAPSPVLAAAPRENDDAATASAPSPAGAASAAATPVSAEEVARRRERAWARFYKRPSTCEGNPSGDQLVECGNHFIRMRREFDERWRNGAL